MEILPIIKIETERLKSGPMTFEFSEPAAEFDLGDDPEYVFEDKVSGTLTATLVGSSTVLVRGTVRTTAGAPCARCLDAIRIPLKADVILSYMTDRMLLDPKRAEQDDDDNTFWYDGQFIYPADQLRELLLLQLPHIPACELEAGDVCPISGKKYTGWHEDLPAAGAAGEPPAESFADKLKKVRKDLK